MFDYGRIFSNLLATIRSFLDGNVLPVAIGVIRIRADRISFLFWEAFLALGQPAAVTIPQKTAGRIRAFSFTSGSLSLMEQRGLLRDTAPDAARVCKHTQLAAKC